MVQKILVLFIILFVVLSETAIIKQPIMGGYTLKTDEQLAKLKLNPDFIKVVDFAKDFWQTNVDQTLGDIVEVQEQIVAGSNFKITFKRSDKPKKQVVIIVFVQPWSNTMKVTFTNPEVFDKHGELKQNLQKN